MEEGGGHKIRGWGKLILLAGSYLVWEGGLHGDLHEVILQSWRRTIGEATRPLAYAPMID